jgi:hypothetical protein
VVVELESVDVAEVSRLADAQDDRLEEAVEAPEDLLRRDFLEVPWPDRVFHRHQQGILPHALIRAAEHQRVVDLVLRVLHPVGEVLHDVVGIVAEHLVGVVEPSLGLRGVAGDDRRRPVEVEASDPFALDPSAL